MWWQIIEILSIQSRELDIKYIAQIHAILRTMQNISFLAMHCFQTIIERFVVLYYFSVHSPVIWDARVIMWRHCNVVRCLNHADCLLFWSLAKKPGAHFTKALWARYPPLWDVRTTLTLKKTTMIKSSHNLAHVTTAALSGYYIALIDSLESKSSQTEFTQDFNCGLTNCLLNDYHP